MKLTPYEQFLYTCCMKARLDDAFEALKARPAEPQPQPQPQQPQPHSRGRGRRRSYVTKQGKL